MESFIQWFLGTFDLFMRFLIVCGWLHIAWRVFTETQAVVERDELPKTTTTTATAATTIFDFDARDVMYINFGVGAVLISKVVSIMTVTLIYHYIISTWF